MRIAGMPFDYSTRPAAMSRIERSLRIAAHRLRHPLRSWRARAVNVTWHPPAGPEGGHYEVRRNGQVIWRGQVIDPATGAVAWFGSPDYGGATAEEYTAKLLRTLGPRYRAE